MLVQTCFYGENCCLLSQNPIQDDTHHLLVKRFWPCLIGFVLFGKGGKYHCAYWQNLIGCHDKGRCRSRMIELITLHRNDN